MGVSATSGIDLYGCEWFSANIEIVGSAVEVIPVHSLS